MGLFKKIWKKAGSVVHDIAKTVVDGTLTIPNAIAGHNVVDTGSYKTKAVGNTIGSVTSLGTDVAKVAVYNVVAPINSITGHQYSPDYKTKVGHVVGDLGEMGVDSVHVLGKTIGDTFTGGYASKLVNTIRSDKNKESYLHYHEANNVSSIKAVESIRKPLVKASIVLGVVVGSKGAGSSSSSTTTPAPVLTSAQNNLLPAASGAANNLMAQDTTQVQQSPVVVMAVIGIVLAVVFFIFKIFK